MKRIIALLAAVMVLAGSVGMSASAATVDTCGHQNLMPKEAIDSIETYTHSVQVGTSMSGKPILAACLVEIGWREYKMVCYTCGARMSNKVKIYEVHSMH